MERSTWNDAPRSPGCSTWNIGPGREASPSAFHVEHVEQTPAARTVLESGLRELSLDEALAPRLAALAHLLARWASRMNLTGHRTPEAIARRLILDALALGAALPTQPTSLADLGSGAGFPGLPIAISHPSCKVLLVEARERRHHFQRAAVRTIGLVNVEARRGRIEEIEPTAHQVVVAQALARPIEAVSMMLRWVAPGGWLVLPRAAEADPLPAIPGLEDVRTTRYEVPAGGPSRSLWVARRPLDASSGPVVRTGRPPDL